MYEMVLLVAFVIIFQFWTFLTASIGRCASGLPIHCDGGGLSDAEIIKQLDRGMNAILSSSAGSLSGDAQKVVDAAKRRSLKSKMIEGFFGNYHSRSADNNKNKSSQEYYENVTVKRVENPDRTNFAAENECESVNHGRPCVCSMADFLDSICQQMDESATVFGECASYKPVMAAFIFSPDASPKVNLPTTVAEKSVRIFKKNVKGNNHGTNETAIAVAWKPINFDNIINYRVEKPKDGRLA